MMWQQAWSIESLKILSQVVMQKLFFNDLWDDASGNKNQ
jgi:hypothetical protein